MRNISTIILLFICVFNVHSQNLTLAEILEVKKKDLGNAEEYLTAKSWEFLDADEPTDETLGTARFTYNKSYMPDFAESVLTFFYSSDSNKTRINIQVNKKNKYIEYLNSIKGYGCKLITSKVEDGKIVKIYRGATTTFEVSSSITTNLHNEKIVVWQIFILSNDDYDGKE